MAPDICKGTCFPERSSKILREVTAMQQKSKRPTGVTQMAGVAIFSGIVETFGGALLYLLGTFLYVVGYGDAEAYAMVRMYQLLGGLTFVAGILGLVFGIVVLKSQRPWLWTLGIVLYVATTLLSIAAWTVKSDYTQPYLLGILLGAVMLYTLFTGDVRRAFSITRYEVPNNQHQP
jgi:hypothetical protein